jgi:iron-sulfur cluster assembly accessory protein|tara:strand:- start:2 stop:382 length:381 start_codon:yes stop_codon:yes gene_type:complete
MSKQIINITTNAFKKMNKIMTKSNNNHGFLFGISSGGCNGFNFDLKLIQEKKELDPILKMKPNIIQDNNVKVYVDPIAEMYLIGTTIDFIDEDYNKGIFESKFIYKVDRELASTCGCGVSFTPKNR